MPVDRYGNPIFSTDPIPIPTGLTLPQLSTTTTSPLQGVIDSIKAPTLAKSPSSSGTLALLLGALGSRTSAGKTGQKAFANIPASTRAGKAAQLAMTQRGVPYKWGGNAWGSALDCSSLVQQAFKRAGVSVPRTTYDQWKTGSSVGKKNLKPGDAVFFHPGKSGPEHVGIYIGNDQFVQAPHTGEVVHTSKLSSYGGYMGARRYR